MDVPPNLVHVHVHSKQLYESHHSLISTVAILSPTSGKLNVTRGLAVAVHGRDRHNLNIHVHVNYTMCGTMEHCVTGHCWKSVEILFLTQASMKSSPGGTGL